MKSLLEKPKYNSKIVFDEDSKIREMIATPLLFHFTYQSDFRPNQRQG